MAETLADYFKSGQLWVKSYQGNYDLNKFARVDFTPDVFEKGSKIEQLIHKFFNTPMTGLNPVRDLFWKRKNYIAFEETQTVYNFAISIANHLDNYFIVEVRHPAVGEAKYDDKDPNQIHLTEDLYIVDGWDGLEDWITHHQINKDNVEFFDIIHLGLPEEDSMKLKLTKAYQNVLKMNKIYPHIFVNISESSGLIRYYQKVIYFQKDASGKYTFYGLFDNHENFYIYRTPEQVKREKFWKEEYDRLYDIWDDYKDYRNKKEINLTEEEEEYLWDNLRNPSWAGHVSDTNANFDNEEIYQKCLELVNKLQDTTKKEGKNFKYLMRYNRYLG